MHRRNDFVFMAAVILMVNYLYLTRQLFIDPKILKK